MGGRPTLPPCRTARGDRILFTLSCDKIQHYISAHQLRAYWPDIANEDQTLQVLTGDDRTYDLSIGYKVQVQGNTTAHRYIMRGTGLKELFQALGAKASDVLGISRDSSGQFHAELSTEEVLQAHALLPQSGPRSAPRRRKASSSDAEEDNSSPSPAAPPSPRPKAALSPAAAPVKAPTPARKPPGASPAKKRVSADRAGTASRTMGQGAPRETAWVRAGGAKRRCNGGDAGGDARPLSHPPLAPMVPLHGETPLNVEAEADEHLPMPPRRYEVMVQRARDGMAARAREMGGDALADRVIAACERYEATCLRGDAPAADAAERRAACIAYDAALREVYGNQIVDPHILDTSALEKDEGSEDLQLLRTMERRFLIWKTSETVEVGVTDAKEETQGAAASMNPSNTSSAPPRRHRWLTGMVGIWDAILQRLGAKTYDEVHLEADMENVNVSCALNDTVWWRGALLRRGVPTAAPVVETLKQAAAGQRAAGQRLYMTDGSMPDYVGVGYPEGAPGMPCRVDAMTNAMFPHAVRSNRSTNLFHFLKNESTGTGTFTAFAGVGPGANLTAFHYETKRRRSYNCAAGDYIAQPLATAENNRRLMRVHAAVAGRHSRHGQLLPLEVYLEAGIIFVTHLRLDANCPTLAELCEQSMHAFITFDDVTSAEVAAATAGLAAALRPPPLKVSCNDFDLVWDVDATYHLENLAVAYGRLKGGLLAEEAPPPDGADTWLQSSYLTAAPNTRAGRAAASEARRRPWACEVDPTAAGVGSELLAAATAPEAQGELEDAELDPGMDVVAVRSAEKLLDVAAGLLAPGSVAPWVGEVPTREEASAALFRLVPVLYHMLGRAWSEEEAAAQEEAMSLDIEDNSGKTEAADPGQDCHFSREYLEDLLERVVAFEAVAAMEPALPADVPADCEDAETLGTRLPPAVLRALWLRRLAEERDAAVAVPLDAAALAAARRRRSAVEAAFDVACCAIIGKHAEWTPGAAAGAKGEEEQEDEAEEVNVTD